MAETTEKRRQRIFDDALAAAREIALEDGLAGLTVRRIATEIGCSVGTIYNVFDNLDMLILHLNGTTFDALYEELIKVETSGEPREIVGNLTEAYGVFVDEYANLWNVIFEHPWPAEYVLPDWYLEKIERIRGFLVTALVPLFPPGRERDNHLAALVLWSGLHGIHSLAAMGKLAVISTEDGKALSDFLVQVFLDGLIYRQQSRDHD